MALQKQYDSKLTAALMEVRKETLNGTPKELTELQYLESVKLQLEHLKTAIIKDNSHGRNYNTKKAISLLLAYAVQYV